MVILNGMKALLFANREKIFRSKVIFLSEHENEEYVIRALRSGAAGYMLKRGRRDG